MCIMKKTLFLMAALMALVMSSCKPFQSYVYYLDYYELGHNGKILLTESNSYSGEYDALGSILISQKSGKEVLDQQTSTKTEVDGDDIYGPISGSKTTTKYKLGKEKKATYSTALEEAVKVAESMGGDAIINLHFNVIPEKSDYRIEVSGMVIKRK